MRNPIEAIPRISVDLISLVSVWAVVTSTVCADQQFIVTKIETHVAGEGDGSASDWITHFPSSPMADYSDSLSVSTPTSSGTRTIDGVISMTEGTTLQMSISYADPEPENPPFIISSVEVHFVVTAATTVHINCAGPGGPEWLLSGDADADIDAPHDGDLALTPGLYKLKHSPELNWYSTIPHTLTITAADAGTLGLDDHDMYVEVFTQMTLETTDVISDANGIHIDSAVQVSATFPDCSSEYSLDAALSFVSDVGSPLGAPGFIATGTAEHSACAAAGCTFTAEFTLTQPHYAIWAASYDYVQDAPLLGGSTLCRAIDGLGCMHLESGDWQLLDGGIFDGTNVVVSLELVSATIRVPEDAATISDAIELAGERASAIQGLEPFCNEPEPLAFTIALDAGIYPESIGSVGPGVDLTIIAADGPGTVEITGDSIARCLALETGYTNVLVDGITFSNGAADFGGAVLIDGPTSVEFRDCAFSNNSASDEGGAIASQGSTNVTFGSCDFNQNHAGLAGGAIALRPTGPITALVDACTIQSNVAGLDGGGLYHVEATGSSLQLIDSTICWNPPLDIGGPWNDLGGNTSCDPCPGDLVPDGTVDGADLSVLLGSWGDCPPKQPCPADLTTDGIVDGADLTILLGAWGNCL